MNEKTTTTATTTTARDTDDRARAMVVAEAKNLCKVEADRLAALNAVMSPAGYADRIMSRWRGQIDELSTVHADPVRIAAIVTAGRSIVHPLPRDRRSSHPSMRSAFAPCEICDGTGWVREDPELDTVTICECRAG